MAVLTLSPVGSCDGICILRRAVSKLIFGHNTLTTVPISHMLVHLEFSKIRFSLIHNSSMHPPAQEVLASLIPEGCDLFDSMSIGYPKNKYRRIPLRLKPMVKWV